MLKFMASDSAGCVRHVEEMPLRRYVEEVVDDRVGGLDVYIDL